MRKRLTEAENLSKKLQF